MRISDWSSDVCSSDLRPRDFLPFKISKETVWKVELSLSDYQAQKKRRCHPRWFDARWRRRRVFQGREAPRYLQLMQLWIDVPSSQRLQREDRKSTRLNSSH